MGLCKKIIHGENKMVDLYSSNIFLSKPFKASRQADGQFDESFKRHLVDISNSIGAGLSLHDTEMNIVWVNDVLSSWFGEPETLMGKKCYVAYQHKERVCHNCPVKTIIDTNKDL